VAADPTQTADAIQTDGADASGAPEEHAVALLRGLIAAQKEGEAAVQGLIAERLAAAGCTVREVAYDPGAVPVRGEFAADEARDAERRRAIVGTLEGAEGLPSLLIFAHPDGEPVAGTERWAHDPFGGEVAGGRLYGWGVADDLAGCAAAILAIEKLAAANAPMGRAVFASTPSKRYARGVAALLHEGLRADASLYLHPAESGVGMREIKAVASGQIEFTVTVTGRAPDTTEPGQTAFAHLGVDPIEKALVVRQALVDLAEARRHRVRHRLIEAEVGRATNIMVSRIRCGEMRRLARMEEVCQIGAAISFPPGETLEEVRAEIEAAIAAAAQSDPWLAEHPPEIAWRTGVTGAEVPSDHPLYRTAREAVLAVTGAEPHVNPMHTSSDIRNPMVEAGIPCVGLGCLGGDLSQNDRHDEWVDVEDFRRMVEVTARIVTAWCGGARAPA
jgi:acetylornithine deacetylase